MAPWKEFPVGRLFGTGSTSSRSTGRLGCLLLAIFLAGGTACQRGGKPFQDPGTLAIRLTENPLTLDPALVVDVTGGSLAAKLYAGLVRFDHRLQIVPDLAASWELAADQRTYHFTLKPQLRFSDGSRLTSRDVLRSWQRVLDPETLSPRAWVLDKIEGAADYRARRTPGISGLILHDEVRLTVVLTEPFAPFLSLLTMPAAFIVPAGGDTSFHPWKSAAWVGSGPYRLTEWRPDVRIRLEPNLHYPAPDSPRCPLMYRIIPEEATAVGMMATGELDIMRAPGQQLVALRKRYPDHDFQKVDELNVYYLGFDHRKSYIDQSFKRAVAGVVDREAWIRNLFGNQASPARSPVPPALLGDFEPTGIPESGLDASRELFRKSRAAGRELVLLVSASKETLAVAALLQDRLKQIGADVRIHPMDWSAFKTALTQGEADLFYLSWWADYADPENFLFPTFYSQNAGDAGNRVFYTNPRMDDLLEILQRESHEPSRKRVLAAIHDILNEDLPWIPLWHKSAVYMTSPRVSGFVPPPMVTMDRGLNLSLRPLEKTT